MELGEQYNKMRVLAYTNRGLKYDHNEDSYLLDGECFCDTIVSNVEENRSVYSVAVFDGVGGANAGEIASQTASQIVSKILKSTSSNDELTDAILKANQVILRLAEEQNGMNGMACTVVGLLLRREDIVVYNLGDSRAYKIKNDMMMQLTIDDNYENYLIKEYGGRAYEGANSHTITAYLGNKKLNKEDIHINVLPAISEAERYFLCSDGVTDYIDIDDLEEILVGETSFEEMSREIRRRVYQNGAKDNFTFIILEK